MSKIEIYTNSNNETSIEVKFENDSAWLSQAQIVELFQRDQSVISRHINNVFKESELDKKSNMQKMHNANSDKPIKEGELALKADISNLELIQVEGKRENCQKSRFLLS